MGDWIKEEDEEYKAARRAGWFRGTRERFREERATIEAMWTTPPAAVPICWASQIPEVRAYLQRIGAHPTGRRRAIIGEWKDRYEMERTVLYFAREGEVEIRNSHHELLSAEEEDFVKNRPTDQEARAIKAALENALFPRHKPVSLDRLRESLPDSLRQQYDDGNIFPATGLDGKVEFVQLKLWEERDVHLKYKSYYPTDYPDDRGWLRGEPDGNLAAFNGHLLALDNGRPKVIHEGAMAIAINLAVERERARLCGEEVPPCPMLEKRQDLKTLLDSPAREFMLAADHAGWAGGANKPFRPDVEPFRKACGRLIFAADNDPTDVGLEGARTLIHRVGRPAELLRFNKAFPDHFDLADKYPKAAEGGATTDVPLAPAPEPAPAPGTITVTYSSVDGVRKVHTFKTLKGARGFAQERVGTHPDLGTGYAVSNDGIGKVEVSGTTLADLFPAPAAEPAAPAAPTTWDACKTEADVAAVAAAQGMRLMPQDTAALVAGFPGVHKTLRSFATYHFVRFPKATPQEGTFICQTAKHGAIVVRDGKVDGPTAGKSIPVVALWKAEQA